MEKMDLYKTTTKDLMGKGGFFMGLLIKGGLILICYFKTKTLQK